MKKVEKIIVCAAVRNTESRDIICSARHFDNLMLSQISSSRLKWDFKELEHGFIDQFGGFYSRREAWIAAVKCGQIDGSIDKEGLLISEDLY